MYIVVSGRGASAEIEASLNNLCVKAGGMLSVLLVEYINFLDGETGKVYLAETEEDAKKVISQETVLKGFQGFYLKVDQVHALGWENNISAILQAFETWEKNRFISLAEFNQLVCESVNVIMLTTDREAKPSIHILVG